MRFGLRFEIGLEIRSGVRLGIRFEIILEISANIRLEIIFINDVPATLC